MAPEPSSPTPFQVTTRREELNEILVDFLGTREVYFQPDANVRMNYPAIVYSMDDQSALFANDKPYRRTDGYELTIIDRNPDMPVRFKVETLNVNFDRSFVADGLNHRVYSLYF